MSNTIIDDMIDNLAIGDIIMLEEPSKILDIDKDNAIIELVETGEIQTMDWGNVGGWLSYNLEDDKIQREVEAYREYNLQY